MSTAALLLPALLLLPSLLAATEGHTVSSACQGSCGGVDIPYPFGIGAGCFRKGFEINCTDAGVPLLDGTSIQVVNLSVDPPESRVLLPVRWQCYQVNVSDGTVVRNMNDTSFFNREKNIPIDGVYRISHKHNELFVLGCATIGIVKTNESQTLASAFGCMSFCRNATAAQDGLCAGAGCCNIRIQPELTSIMFEFPNIRENRPDMLNYSPCDYAFIVDKDNYTFQSSDLLHMDRTRTMPARLDWAIREMPSLSTKVDAPVSTTLHLSFLTLLRSLLLCHHRRLCLATHRYPKCKPQACLTVHHRRIRRCTPSPGSTQPAGPFGHFILEHMHGSPPMPAISLLRPSTACGHLEEPQRQGLPLATSSTRHLCSEVHC